MKQIIEYAKEHLWVIVLITVLVTLLLTKFLFPVVGFFVGILIFLLRTAFISAILYGLYTFIKKYI